MPILLTLVLDCACLGSADNIGKHTHTCRSACPSSAPVLLGTDAKNRRLFYHTGKKECRRMPVQPDTAAFCAYACVCWQSAVVVFAVCVQPASMQAHTAQLPQEMIASESMHMHKGCGVHAPKCRAGEYGVQGCVGGV